MDKDPIKMLEPVPATYAKVTVALGSAALAARQFGRAIEEGAGLQLVERRFDRLAESIGTSP